MLLHFPYVSWYNLVLSIVEHTQAESVCLQLKHEEETLRHLPRSPQNCTKFAEAQASSVQPRFLVPAACISCLSPLYTQLPQRTVGKQVGRQ